MSVRIMAQPYHGGRSCLTAGSYGLFADYGAATSALKSLRSAARRKRLRAGKGQHPLR